MGKRIALSSSEIEQSLADLAGWQVVDGKLIKTFAFKSFAAAMGWMMSVAIVAEKMDHHPEWSNVYNRVAVTLITHDMGNKISSWDVDLALAMERLAVGEV